MAETMTFATISEAEQYVTDALQEWSSHFDVEAIAREVTEWSGGVLTLRKLDSEFWHVVVSHDMDRHCLSAI